MPVRIVHQEDERFVVFAEVPKRDVLGIPRKVRQRERVFVEHLEEAFRAAAVLNVRLPIRAAAGLRGGAPPGGCQAAATPIYRSKTDRVAQDEATRKITGVVARAR